MAERRPRVLWLIKGLGAGGAERLLCTLAVARDRDAAEVEASYVLAWKDALAEELAGAGVLVHPLGVARLADVRWLLRLRRLISQGRFDVVHTHSPAVASAVRVVVRTIPRRRRPALVTTEHSQWSGHPLLTQVANRVTFGLDAAHIAVADTVRDSLPDALAKKVDVVRQGIDVADVRARAADHESVRAEFGIGADDVLVVTVANLRRHKGYPDLLDAAARIRNHEPRIRFLAAGQGPLASELRAEAARLGISADGDPPTFRFLGFRVDALRLVAAADIFVLPSRIEGLPIALVEAFALGIPAVATKVGEVAQVVTDGEHGLLVAAADPVALADAISMLAGDSERRAAMGRAAVERAADFDIRSAVRHHEAMYRALTAAADAA